jgi:tetratricopeptide (TPR) repeat protein
MRLNDQLAELRATRLIRLTAMAPDPEYIFQHTLMQETAYESLLKQDRRVLHLSVGNALEQLYAGQLEDRAAMLARHFEEAGDDDRALIYFTLAGERAMRQYALPEAVMHYTSALAVAERRGAPQAKFLRARGLAYEALGDFERARADQEAALRVAALAQDQHAEWQALLDLGMLWAGRDYARTGEHYRRAFELARAMNHPRALAYSLNRLGNWRVNIEQPTEGLQYHEQALAIFHTLEDRHGLAETYDLLGMASTLGGNLIRAKTYYARAIALARELDDRAGLISSITTLTLGAPTRQTDTLPSADTLAQAIRNVEEARTLSQQIGLRSAESYAEFAAGFCLSARGEFGRALESAQRSLSIAREIGHRQWMCGALCAVGAIHLDLLALEEAQRHLEHALALGKEIGSLNWIRSTSGFAASAYISRNELERAGAILADALAEDAPAQTIGERLVWCARAELALARGDAARALAITDRLIQTDANADRAGYNILRVSFLRGQAFAALGNPSEAEASLRAAREIASAQSVLPRLWQIYAALAELHRAQGRKTEAEEASSAARQIVAELTEKISDASLRKSFVEGAQKIINK